MNNEPKQQYDNRLELAILLLEPLGWLYMGAFFFFKGGKVYDLSAADLSQIDRIERDGLFVEAE